MSFTTVTRLREWQPVVQFPAVSKDISVLKRPGLFLRPTAQPMGTVGKGAEEWRCHSRSSVAIAMDFLPVPSYHAQGQLYLHKKLSLWLMKHRTQHEHLWPSVGVCLRSLSLARWSCPRGRAASNVQEIEWAVEPVRTRTLPDVEFWLISLGCSLMSRATEPSRRLSCAVPWRGGGGYSRTVVCVWAPAAGLGVHYKSYTRDFWKKKRTETESVVERKECSKQQMFR